MTLHYSARYSSADILEEARQFAGHFEKIRPVWPIGKNTDQSRPLRVGYVSADLRNHPVGYFLAGVLPCHDPKSVQVFCYSNSRDGDAMTQRLKVAEHVWRNISALSDNEAADLIRQDGIDILVDLSGHTGKNRLSLFMLKPAPIQVSWIGYFGTTGLRSIDYILADRFVAPQGEEVYFTEKVWRLPSCYLCYEPHQLDVPIGPPPMLINGYTTFGCFNKRAKIGPETVAIWAKILQRVTRSKLFLKTRSMADLGVQRELSRQFAQQGVDDKRLIFEGHSELAEAMSAYSRVDVALDPFPFGGCATTAETLWMWVPLITLRGQRWSGRMSESILSSMGLESWVATDEDAYVALASQLGNKPQHLAWLRANLRHQLDTSPLCDGRRFTGDLEGAYRSMWRAWVRCHSG